MTGMGRKVMLLAAVFWVVSGYAFSAECGKTPQRTITVTGTAEVRAAPDEVYLSLAVNQRSRNLKQAKAEADTCMTKALGIASRLGIEPRYVKTGYVFIEPRYDKENEGKSINFYEVQRNLEIVLKDLSKYDELLLSCLEAGFNEVQYCIFQVANERPYRDQARELAVQAAREKAALMAGKLGQKIGRVVSIVEEGRPDRYASMQNVLQESPGQAESITGTLSPGMVVIRSAVTVTFELE